MRLPRFDTWGVAGGDRTYPIDPAATPPALVALGDTQWRVWPDFLVRATGFPADGLDRLHRADAAAAVDAALGQADDDNVSADVSQAVSAAEERDHATMSAIVEDPLFREAVTWQNPTVAALFERYRTAGPPTNSKQRRRRHDREIAYARYWTRYCGKNDTIGFFGPVGWGTVDPDCDVPVRTSAGPGLVRQRIVRFEYWALQEFVAALAAHPGVRPWLWTGLRADLSLDEAARTVRGLDDAPVDEPAWSLLRGARQRPHVHELVAAVAAETDRPAAAVTAALDDLAARGLVWLGVDLPFNSEAEPALVRALAAITDAPARDRALASWNRLREARDELASRAGDPDAVFAAGAALDTVFEDVAGGGVERASGQSYAGRRVYYEDCVRDADVTIGAPLLAELAGPLDVLLTAARWLSARMREHYAGAFEKAFDDLADGREAVPLPEFWMATQELITGAERPSDTVTAEFAERITQLVGVADADPAQPVRIASADVIDRARQLFPADGPGWAGARIHSPDLQLCAPDEQTLAAGNCPIVLGELHAAWPTLDNAVFVTTHPDPDALVAAAARDIGRQVRPLYPTDWPQYTARIAPILGVDDYQFAFTAAPGADRTRLLPITAYEVARADGRLVTRPLDPGLPRLAVDDVYALLVGWLASEALKLGVGGAHSPRVSVDNLVLARESWRTTVGDIPWHDELDAARRYREARRWRAELGLPERVYVRIESEKKPVYLDLTSPLLITACRVMMQSAVKAVGERAAVTISEMLPQTSQAWLPDGAGRRYISELRLQLVDPLLPPAGPAPGTAD